MRRNDGIARPFSFGMKWMEIEIGLRSPAPAGQDSVPDRRLIWLLGGLH